MGERANPHCTFCQGSGRYMEVHPGAMVVCGPCICTRPHGAGMRRAAHDTETARHSTPDPHHVPRRGEG